MIDSAAASAATKIQAVYRGHQVRRSVAAIQADKEKLAASLEGDEAKQFLSRAVDGLIAKDVERRKAKGELEKAQQLQEVQRTKMILAEKMASFDKKTSKQSGAGAAKRPRRAAGQQLGAQAAASRIQAVFHGYRVRRQVEKAEMEADQLLNEIWSTGVEVTEEGMKPIRDFLNNAVEAIVAAEASRLQAKAAWLQVLQAQQEAEEQAAAAAAAESDGAAADEERASNAATNQPQQQPSDDDPLASANEGQQEPAAAAAAEEAQAAEPADRAADHDERPQSLAEPQQPQPEKTEEEPLFDVAELADDEAAAAAPPPPPRDEVPDHEAQEVDSDEPQQKPSAAASAAASDETDDTLDHSLSPPVTEAEPQAKQEPDASEQEAAKPVVQAQQEQQEHTEELEEHQQEEEAVVEMEGDRTRLPQQQSEAIEPEELDGDLMEPAADGNGTQQQPETTEEQEPAGPNERRQQEELAEETTTDAAEPSAKQEEEEEEQHQTQQQQPLQATTEADAKGEAEEDERLAQMEAVSDTPVTVPEPAVSNSGSSSSRTADERGNSASAAAASTAGETSSTADAASDQSTSSQASAHGSPPPGSPKPLLAHSATTKSKGSVALQPINGRSPPRKRPSPTRPRPALARPSAAGHSGGTTQQPQQPQQQQHQRAGGSPPPGATKLPPIRQHSPPAHTAAATRGRGHNVSNQDLDALVKAIRNQKKGYSDLDLKKVIGKLQDIAIVYDQTLLLPRGVIELHPELLQVTHKQRRLFDFAACATKPEFLL